MKSKILFYLFTCDICGQKTPQDGGSVPETWRKVKGRHYCHHCKRLCKQRARRETKERILEGIIRGRIAIGEMKERIWSK